MADQEMTFTEREMRAICDEVWSNQREASYIRITPETAVAGVLSGAMTMISPGVFSITGVSQAWEKDG